ncbi:MAG: SMP-30/gluconolactonase/LRE family protein [Burkholderiales bacterium]|nr:MAG: SMP-30/gluconolactonase/LRE family protein [Burkholderiales bacterium]
MPTSLPRWLVVLLALLTALLLYFAFWPVPIRPLAWESQASPGYAGAHAANTRLANLQKINIGQESGPEHIAMGKDGKLYAAVSSGAILRMNPDGSELSTFVKTDGRVLGFDFDAQGNMIAANEVRGLLSVTPAGEVTVLADKVGDQPIRFADAVVVAKSGKIYMSDASTRFAPKDWGGSFEASVLDILEQSATGRILEFDPATKAIRIVAKGLSFANGIALSANERQIFVAETGRYRVWRIDVNASDLDVRQTSGMSGATHIVLPNLPGYPDNLMRGLPTKDGKPTLWVGLAKPRSALVDKMAGKPWMRTLTLRLPRFLWPIPPKYGHVISFTEDGTILADLQDPSGTYPETTGVLETTDKLYVQSLHAGHIGWMKKP